MADLGLKKETREREAVRPEEHRAAETETAPAAEEEKGT